jgi:RHS repeat-associated protein
VVRPFDAGSRYQKTEAERRSKAEHLGTTFYGWDGDRLAWESTEESCVHYLYEPGSFAPIAQARSNKPIQLHRTPDWTGKAYKFSEDPLWQQSPQPHPFTQIIFYHCDQIGTPQEMTDENGNIAWQAQYKAWGEAKVVIEKVRNPLRFQGQYFDHETGLHYNRFRYYDPEIGRYLSKDPIGFAGGLNLHAYVANPVQRIDPLGLFQVCARRTNYHDDSDRAYSYAITTSTTTAEEGWMSALSRFLGRLGSGLRAMKAGQRAFDRYACSGDVDTEDAAAAAACDDAVRELMGENTSASYNKGKAYTEEEVRVQVLGIKNMLESDTLNGRTPETDDEKKEVARRNKCAKLYKNWGSIVDTAKESALEIPGGTRETPTERRLKDMDL